MSVLSLQSFGNYPSLLITYPPPNQAIIDEISQFKSTLFRNADETSVENGCRQLIKKYTELGDWSSLYYLFCVIRETRECLQERQLTYIQLYAWYGIHPMWATSALTDCVYSYGCWKDIKYLCDYCKKKSSRQDHPFILFAICLLDRQLKEDWKHYELGHPPCEISYAAKWTPRENSKYGWIYTMLCAGYFGYMSGAITVKQNEGALKKSKMSLRKILSTLNKYLDTVELKMCGNHWDYIKPHKVPIHAAFKYHKSFYSHGLEVKPRALPTPSPPDPTHPTHPTKNKPQYPYSNIKSLADRLNADYEMDQDMETQTNNPNPAIKTSKECRQNFNSLVTEFFGASVSENKSLSIIDIPSLTTHDINTAIGLSCVECRGTMVLLQSGKHKFFSFSKSDGSQPQPQPQPFCERVQELSKIIKDTSNLPQSAPTDSSSHLKQICRFMEKCFDETEMNEKERKSIRFFVFSRQPLSNLQEIFKRDIFELRGGVQRPNPQEVIKEN
jgi:hypothetical protein